MGRALFRFHGELEHFLSKDQRGKWLQYDYRGAPSLKHAIETFGVPHPEVGAPADLARPLTDGESLNVYHRDYHNQPDQEWRFVLDCHLGRLAKHLRILGFDTLYRPQAEDGWLAAISNAEGRVLLTMDRGLLQRSLVEQGSLVRAALPREQLQEVILRFHLAGQVRPLRRCLRCNGLLEDVPKSSVIDQIPPKTRVWCNEYRRCADCLQLYWAGSHYERMMEWIESLGVIAGRASRSQVE